MKKYLLIALSTFALTFTACHDDDDEEGSGDYVMSYETPKVNTTGIFDMIANTTGVSTFTFSDAMNYSDLYFFSNNGQMVKDYATQSADLSLTGAALDSLFGTYFGGFYPTWYAANDEEQWFTPYNETYHSGNGALICNPGLVCRALFSKHMQADLSTAMSYILLKDIKCLYINTTSIYKLFEEEEGNAELRKELEIADLPANSRIEFLVYGYVDSFRFNDFKSFLSALKGGATQVASGGKAGTAVTVAETDANGKTTVKVKDWTRVDLGNISDCYLFEAYLRIVDNNGKTIDTYDLNGSWLNYILVDDITYNGRL